MSEKKMVKTTLSITLIILLSKLCGFARDVVSAGYFGTSMARDAYASAYTLFYIPVLLFNSCITSTLVPLYVNARDQKSRLDADRFASNCINVFAIAALGAALIMMCFTGPLVKLVFGGFSAEKQLLTAQLTRIMLPSLSFVVVSIVLSSVLNANENYLPAQLTGYPLTVCLIIATVAFSPSFGIQAVAWGVFVAGIMQMAILLPFCRKSVTYRLHIDLSDPQLKQMLFLALPAILSMAVNELNHIIDKSICSYLNPGDPSAMDYAYRLITFATGVLAVPITTIMFSRMSVRAAQHNEEGVRQVLSQSSLVLTMILLPFTLMGCVLSEDIIKLAYMHGNFDLESLRVTSSVFFFYMLGLLGFGLRDVFSRVFHALLDTKTPMAVACFSVTLNILLNVILSRFMGVNGLALATTISCGAGAIVLLALLKKKLNSLGSREDIKELGKTILAGLICAGGALLLNRFWPEAWGKGWVLLRLIGIVGAGFVLYLGTLIALKAKQLRTLVSIIRRRK